jgi:hypothetical protein
MLDGIWLTRIIRGIFDKHIKPKIYETLIAAGIRNLPKSRGKSIHMQAAAAPAGARKNSSLIV